MVGATRQQVINGNLLVKGNLTVTHEINKGILQTVRALGNSAPAASIGVGYRSPALFPSGYSGTTSTPTAPSVKAVGAYKAVVLMWDFQSDLLNLQRYEIQCSADGGTTWYSLSNNMTTGLGTLNAITQTATEVYVHSLAPGTTLSYRVRRVNKISGADNDGSWSATVSNTASSNALLGIASATIYAALLVVGALYFTEKVASQPNLTPSAGDYRSSLTKGSFEIDEYINSIWQTLFSVAPGVASNTLDVFTTGRVLAGGGLYSLTPPSWESISVTAFTGDIYALFYAGSTLLGGTAQGELGYSTDNGQTWTKVTSPFTISEAISQFAYDGSSKVVVIATDGNMAYSTDNGATWNTIASPFSGTSSTAGIVWDGSNFVAGASSQASHSSDGTTWSAAIIPPYALAKMAIVGTTVVSAGPGNTFVQYSTDSGQAWTAVTGLSHSVEGTIVSTGSRLVVGGDTGHIGYSDDTGKTWTWVSTGDTGSIITVAYANGVLYAGSTSSVCYHSTDLGLTWTSADAPFTTGYLRAVAGYNYTVLAVADGLQSAYLTWTQAGAGIVESGSNSNGSWVKWADGTMICLSSIQTLSSDSSGSNFYGTTSGTTYYKSSTWTYPKSFVALLGVWPMETADGTVLTMRVLSPGVSSATIQVFGAASFTAALCKFAAIGKWK